MHIGGGGCASWLSCIAPGRRRPFRRRLHIGAASFATLLGFPWFGGKVFRQDTQLAQWAVLVAGHTAGCACVQGGHGVFDATLPGLIHRVVDTRPISTPLTGTANACFCAHNGARVQRVGRGSAAQGDGEPRAVRGSLGDCSAAAGAAGGGCATSTHLNAMDLSADYVTNRTLKSWGGGGGGRVRAAPRRCTPPRHDQTWRLPRHPAGVTPLPAFHHPTQGLQDTQARTRGAAGSSQAVGGGRALPPSLAFRPALLPRHTSRTAP